MVARLMVARLMVDGTDGTDGTGETGGEVVPDPITAADFELQVMAGEANLTGQINVDAAEDAVLTYELTQGASGFELNDDGSYTFDPTHPAYAFVQLNTSIQNEAVVTANRR